jgi:hypothetical protein
MAENADARCIPLANDDHKYARKTSRTFSAMAFEPFPGSISASVANVSSKSAAHDQVIMDQYVVDIMKVKSSLNQHFQ